MSHSLKKGPSHRNILLVSSVLMLFLFGTIFYSSIHDFAQSNPSGITTQWLSQESAVWKPAVNGSVMFQTWLDRASYGNLEQGYNSPTVQQEDLNMSFQTGASCVRIDIGFAPWLQNNQTAINEMNSIVQQIHAAGKCLVIADGSSESYRNGGKLLWSQFQVAWVQRVKTLATLYHPNYYIVIKEPGWYVPMVSDAFTNPSFQNLTDWLSLTSTLASTVLAASPSTKVGVSIAADSLSSNPSNYDPFLVGLSTMANISFIGFDIYDVTGFQATQNYLDQYGAGSKSVWIAEAWSGDGSFIYDSSRSQLDVQWLLTMYYYAQYIHASAIMPFYTDLFASYSLTNVAPTDAPTIVSLFQQRTPAFYEYQQIIAGSNSTSQTTSTVSQSTSAQTFGVPGPSTSSTTTTTSSTRSSQSTTKLTTSSSTTQAVTSVSIDSNKSSSGSSSMFIYAAVAAIVVVIVGVAFAFMRKRS